MAWPAATIPAIRVAGRFPLNERGHTTTYLGATHALHLHGYAGEMRIGGDIFDLEEGDLTVTPAQFTSTYDLAASGHHWCVHFQPVAEGMADAIPVPLHLRLGSAASHARERLVHISRLHARAHDDRLAGASAAVALQELLLWCATRVIANDKPEMVQVVERVAAIIDARFHEPVSAARLAAEVGRSQNYVARHFRRRFGMTVPHYALTRRAAHARYLLESTDLPIRRIAERVGFPDPQYFNKQMRRLLGESPSAIRAKAS